MKSKDPKTYTRNTIQHEDGARITEVLKKYWKYASKQKTETLIDKAKDIFEIKEK